MKNNIAVCIITYKRPKYIVNTINSIINQELPDSLIFNCINCNNSTPVENISYDIIIIDNDKDLSSKHVIDNFNKDNNKQIIYLHEENQGIPYARNKAVSYATNKYKYIAFTDDDDRVDKHWLKELLTCMYQYNAHAIQGAIVCDFEGPIPNWVDGETNPFVIYNRKRQQTGKSLSACSTGNVLVDTRIFKEYPKPFNISFAKTGGSDTHFFRKLNGKYKMIYCDEAIVYEKVPLSRQTYKWNFMRIFRNGNASALILKVNKENKKLKKDTLKWIFKLLHKMIFAPIILPLMLIFYKFIPFKQVIKYICRVYYGFGYVFGAMGYKYHEYKKIHGE